MAALGLQEFVDSLRQWATADELFSAFRADIEAEGFQNITFGRLRRGKFFDAPFVHVPDGAAGVYFNENFEEDDPVVLQLQHKGTAFTWAESNARFGQTRAAQTVIEVCRDLGLHSGISIPFHGPNGRCDIFSLSLRDKRTIDPARITIITMKTYATWLRFNEIQAASKMAALVTKGHARADSSAADSGSPAHHSGGPAKITREECRALVIADVSHRRYRAGLTELNDMISSVIGPDMFNQLQYRGLLVDEPDEDRMRFAARPSPIGMAHLKTCSCVPAMRDEVWQLYVNVNERPDR